MTPDSPRATLRAALLSVAARLPLDECGGTEPLTIVLTRGGVEIRYTFSAADIALHAAQTNPLDQLDDTDLAIARRLTLEPVTGPQIASVLKVDYENSGIRKRLGRNSNLRRLGVIDHVEGEGYVLTENGEKLLKNKAERAG